MTSKSTYLRILPCIRVVVNGIYTAINRHSFGNESAINHGVFVQGSSDIKNWRVQPHTLLDTVLEVLQRLQVFPGGWVGGWVEGREGKYTSYVEEDQHIFDANSISGVHCFCSYSTIQWFPFHQRWRPPPVYTSPGAQGT